MTNALLQTQMLLPIDEIARKLALLPTEYEPIGTYGAKLRLELLDNPAFLQTKLVNRASKGTKHGNGIGIG